MLPQAKRQNLKRMVAAGRVTVNGEPARSLKDPVAEADIVEVLDRPAPRQRSIEPLRIVHEDPDLIVIEKPAGLLTSTVPREKRPTAIAILRRYLLDREPNARAGIVHRLDRDASGLLVFSKNNPTYEALKSQLFKREVTRVYTALVHGTPSPREGEIDQRLVELPDGTVRVTRRPDAGERAVTEYTVLRTANGMSLLRVKLLTGRKHQIRVHLYHRGHPIVGDPVYGRPDAASRAKPAPAPAPAAGKRVKSLRLMLAATLLEMRHPRTGEALSFEIPPPKEMTRLLDEG